MNLASWMVTSLWIDEREDRIEAEALKQEFRNKLHDVHKVAIGPNSFMYAVDGDPRLYLSQEEAILSHHKFVQPKRDIPPNPVRICK